LARNILEGRFAQGGSTITQQLVKNAFLTHKKTLGRKLNEQLMAVLLETQVDKDQILQAYINEIYMGQSGPLELRGLAAASHYYFNRSLADLQLADCALLAALINSPGRYNPFSHPEAARRRRALVLERMQKLNMISSDEQSEAAAAPLPTVALSHPTEPAPYVVNQLNQEIKSLPHENGLRVLTSVNLQAQTQAQTSLRSGLENLENQFASLKKRKEAGHVLEGALLSIDVATGNILAVVGGRAYKQTQLNRVFESRRQIGSTVKPFIYLTALESAPSTYTPLSILDDTPLEYHYQGQTWSPKNDDSRFRGKLPLYYALKESLNVPTAKLGLALGLENIVEVIHRAGVDDPIELLPSLTLGAFEIKPIELAQAYLTIARFGSKVAPGLLVKVEDDTGKALLDVTTRLNETAFKPDLAARVLGMLKNTLISGTAKSSSRLGFQGFAAGKTGTTSDTKDAWFAGTTPEVLTIVWVGYDDNEHVGLSGAYAALPIWVDFMTHAFPSAGSTDFAWPEGVRPHHIDSEELRGLFDQLPESETPGVDLVM
jgi:penicillin-binding protein 1B